MGHIDQTGLKDEDDMQERLEEEFTECGWRVAREEKTRDGAGRADLIVSCDKFGTIGIETKFFNRDGGAKLADAHHQIIKKYRGEEFGSVWFSDGPIDLWAFCPCFAGHHRENPERWYEQRATFRKRFAREFFCRHGVGFLDIGAGGDSLVIDFGYSMAERKIPVAAESRHHENVDITAIRESVQKKIEEYSYTESVSGGCEYKSTAGECGLPAPIEMEIHSVSVNLCEHHAEAVEKRIAADQADAAEKQTMPNRGRLYDIPKDVPGAPPRR